MKTGPTDKVKQRTDWRRISEDRNRSMVIPVVVSAVCHIALFAFIIFFPTQATPNKILPSAVVNVDLVSLPSAEPAPKTTPTTSTPISPQPPPEPPPADAPPEPEKVAQPAAPEPAPEAEPETVQLDTKKKDEPPKARYKEKTSLKKKTFRSDNVVKSAISKLEKKVEKERPTPVEDAIERLKKTVKDEDYKERLIGSLQSRVAVQGSGGGEKNGSQAAELLQIYKVEIAYRIQQNWAFPDQLAGHEKDLKTLLVFKVMPNGEIKDLFFTEKSGNPYLDESAYRAVVKSNPVLPHPDGVTKPYITVGLRFTPEGVK